MFDLFAVRSEPAVTAEAFTTFGSNFNAITAMASGVQFQLNGKLFRLARLHRARFAHLNLSRS